MFLIKFLLWRGCPDPLYLFHTTPWCQVRSQGGLSGGGGCAACTFARIGTCCALWLMGLVAQGKGVYTIFSPTLKTLKSASMSQRRHQKHLALLTVSPGHGSAFQRLPCQQRGHWGCGEGAWLSFGVYRVRA